MKVAIVNSDLLPVPPVLGGPIEQMLFETATSLKGLDLSVISRWASEVNGATGADPGMFFHVDIGAQKDRLRRALGRPAVSSRFCYVNGVADLLLALDPDLIEVHNQPGFLSFLTRQFPEKPHVLYMHNGLHPHDSSMGEAAARCRAMVFVSHYLARHFQSRHPDAADKAQVIHNSVDTEIFHPRLRNDERTNRVRERYGLCGKQTVLFVGRTVQGKGVHCLLDAIEIVARVLPDVRLLVVGSPLFGAVDDSHFLAGMRRLASSLGDTVSFAGYVDYEQIPFCYAAADVTVVPSLCEEAFGKVVIESMATGTPVIGSRRGGIPEIVTDGADGILIADPRDAGLLACRLVEMLDDPDARRELGSEARRTAVARFALQTRLDKLRQLYQALAA